MSIHDLGLSALRALDPEDAHKAALLTLKLGLAPYANAARYQRLNTTVAGLDLANPIGVAAGLDKNGEVPDALMQSGFGFVECGTVTPEPQKGNPRPRLFRLTEDRAVINRMGFNNDGVHALVAKLQYRLKRGGIVGANVGANKESQDRSADYVACMKRAWGVCSYVTANISSPNTPGLRGLQERGALEDLLGRMREARGPLEVVHGKKPLFLKVAPDLDEAAVRDIAELAVQYRLDALIVSNTTIARPDSLASRFKSEAGVLSGRPLFEPSTQILRLFAQALGGKLPLIGVGGIEDGKTALAKIKAGASAVQLYSALVYEGPWLVKRIARELDEMLSAEGFARVGDAVGVDV